MKQQYDMLLYQANVLPSSLAMLFLVFNTWQTIFTLNMVDVAATGVRVMEIILLNIFLSFLVFIVASEIKRYNSRWSWAALGIGVFQCLRFFFIPPGGQHWARLNIAIPLLLAGFLLLAASLWSLAKCRRYRIAKHSAEKESVCHT